MTVFCSYWASSGLTLEARLSSQWLINIAFVGNVISAPIPIETFRLPGSTEFNPSPPPLTAIIQNILPSIWSKTLVSKGIQSPSSLVQHTTAVTLAKVIEKFEAVVAAFKNVEQNLQEVEGGLGQWATRRLEVEQEIKRRVPNFEVIVAFSQHKPVISSDGVENKVRNDLIAESGLRLMWLYHRSLPSIPAEARCDVGKLLASATGQNLIRSADSGDGGERSSAGFGAVSQLNLLRLFHHSGQFAWSSKLG